MGNFSKKKRISILCGVAVVLVIVILSVFSCTKKEKTLEKDSDNTIHIESQEGTSDTDDAGDSTTSEDEETSKEDTLNSSKQETESQQDTYNDIFETQSDVTDNQTNDMSEEDSSDQSEEDDATQEKDTKENLEESDDTSTGYGDIS